MDNVGFNSISSDDNVMLVGDFQMRKLRMQFEVAPVRKVLFHMVLILVLLNFVGIV